MSGDWAVGVRFESSIRLSTTATHPSECVLYLVSSKLVSIAQRIRALPCEGRGRRSDSS